MATTKTAKKKVGVKKQVVKTTRIVKKPTTMSVCVQQCKPEHSFWVNNGPVVDSVCGLHDAIEAMSDETYQYHTTRNGNDFASWIKFCIGDSLLAGRVAKAKSRVEAAHILAGCCK